MNVCLHVARSHMTNGRCQGVAAQTGTCRAGAEISTHADQVSV